MKKTLEFIINSILGHKETKIFEEEPSPGQIILTIDSPTEDLGKIIGKKGKIINAIRKLLKVRAAKEGKRVFVKLTQESQSEKGLLLGVAEAEEKSGIAIPS